MALTAGPIYRATVGPGDFPDGSIAGAKLADDSADARVLGAGAVTVTAIADDAVTTPKLIAGAVTAAKVLAGAIDVSKLAAGTLAAGNITAGTIRAAIRMESPDIVAVDPGNARRFARLRQGLLAFGDDGRLSAAQAGQTANADYVVVGKYIEGADRIAPAWTSQTLTAVNAISGLIDLGAWRSFPATASGKPGSRAGLYARTGSLAFLAIDSQPAVYSGSITGLSSVSFGAAAQGNGGRTTNRPWWVRIGGVDYRCTAPYNAYISGFTPRYRRRISVSRANMSDPSTGSAVRDVTFDNITPGSLVTITATGSYVFRWRDHLAMAATNNRSYTTEDEYDPGQFQDVGNTVVSSIIGTAAPIALGETTVARSVHPFPGLGASDDGRPEWGVGRDAAYYQERALAAACAVTISGSERLCTLWADGSLWVTAASVTPANFTDAHVKGEQRGNLTFPSAWGFAWPASPGLTLTMPNIVAMLEVSGSLVTVHSDRSLWTFALGAGTAAVTAAKLGTMNRGTGAVQAAWELGGNVFVVRGGQIWCADFAGSAIAWTRVATLGTVAPDDDWNAARSERWQSLAVQGQKAYPGSLARNAPLILHTRPDGSQSLGAWDGAAKLWSRPGEGSISGAPVRLVPVADIRGKVGALAVPSPPSSGYRTLQLRLHSDGRLELV